MLAWVDACFHNAAGKRRPLDDPCSDPTLPPHNELNPVEARWILFWSLGGNSERGGPSQSGLARETRRLSSGNDVALSQPPTTLQ